MVLAALAACGDGDGDDARRSEACAADGVQLAWTAQAGEEEGDVAALTAAGDVVALTDDGGSYDPAVSPDGSRVAYAGVGPDGEVSDSFGPDHLGLWLVSADGSDRRALLADETAPDDVGDSDPAWSPDGRRIAFVRRTTSDAPSRILVVAPDADRPVSEVLVTPDRATGATDPAWSPDGEHLVYVSGGVEVVVVAADGSDPRVVLTDADGVGSPSFSPSGGQLAVATSPVGEAQGEVTIVDLDDGETQVVASTVRAPWWSASGRIYGYARPPTIRDDQGAWRVAELEVGVDGLTGRAVGGTEPLGYLYAGTRVSSPACAADAVALTRVEDEPETLTVADPVTGEEVEVLTRQQAEARLAGLSTPTPDLTHVRSRLIFADEALRAFEDPPLERLVWVVGIPSDGIDEIGAVLDAVTGAFLGSGSDPDTEPWSAYPDLAPDR